jgi:magnesium transporter
MKRSTLPSASHVQATTAAPATIFNDAEVVTFDDLRTVPRRLGRSSLLWIDIDRSDSALKDAASLLGLESDTTARLADRGGAPMGLDDRSTYAHLTAEVPVHPEAEEPTIVDCVVAERWVLTVRDTEIEVLRSFHERADGPAATGRLDGPEFLAILLEWILGRYATAFEGIEDELEEMDVQALRGRLGDPEDAMRTLVAIRRRIGKLQRSLTSHRDALTALTHPELAALATEGSARRFRAVVERFDLTLDGARDARTSVVASFDVVMARTEHRTNEILKVLTLASVVFLPGSLIAGLLGMNFKAGLFTHANLFWIVVVAVVVMIATTTTLARRRHWI